LSKWLRDELARSLGPVRAPEGLWERIERGRQAETVVQQHWTGWAVAAIVVLATVVGTYRLPHSLLGTEVAVLADTSEAARAADNPAEWDLRCAPPSGRSVFRVANLSAKRGHPLVLAVSSAEYEVAGCQACHSTGAIQHHL
jgi:hypothetical protein